MDRSLENLQTLVSDKRIAKAMKAREHEDIVLEEDNGEIRASGYFLEFSPPGFKTNIPNGPAGWLSVSLAEKICNLIFTS